MSIFQFRNDDGTINRDSLPALKAAGEVTDETGRPMRYVKSDRTEAFFIYDTPRYINEAMSAFGRSYDLV